MPRPYSQDLRERVVRAVEAGASCHEASATSEVSPSSAIRWVARGFFRQQDLSDGPWLGNHRLAWSQAGGTGSRRQSSLSNFQGST
ncbi:MAG: IS630 transposase-related protein [Steroidobacteraceae bacterium]